MWAAARAAAAHWDLRPPVLIRLGMNGIFNAGGVVLRAGRVTADAVRGASSWPTLLRDAGVRVPVPARPDAVVATAS